MKLRKIWGWHNLWNVLHLVVEVLFKTASLGRLTIQFKLFELVLKSKCSSKKKIKRKQLTRNRWHKAKFSSGSWGPAMTRDVWNEFPLQTNQFCSGMLFNCCVNGTSNCAPPRVPLTVPPTSLCLCQLCPHQPFPQGKQAHVCQKHCKKSKTLSIRLLSNVIHYYH